MSPEPTISQLQLARIAALRAGDRQRAAMCALVVRQRLEAAQRAAAEEFACPSPDVSLAADRIRARARIC